MVNEKLLSVQQELKAPKNQNNTFGGYKYRSCEDILEAVKPLLKKNGLVLTLSDEIVEVGGRVYVKATAIISGDGENIVTTAFAREEETKKGMDAAQITGSASSYARKYALNGLFCIDDTKDPDATNDHGKDEDQAPKKTKKSEPPKEEPPHDPYLDVCTNCGKTIMPFISDGKKYSVETIVKSTTKKFGAPFCWDCAMKESKKGAK